MSFYCYTHQMESINIEQQWQQQRCYLFGDGHFTTAKVSGGKLELFHRHIQRLQHANNVLQFGEINWTSLKQKLHELSTEIGAGVIKVQIGRGLAQRGYGNALGCKPLISIWALPQQSPSLADKTTPPELTLHVADTRLGLNPILAGLKHCNRLEQVLIANEMQSKNWQEALVLDIEHNVVESSKGNLFWFDGDAWHTPAIELAGIDGVVRQEILANLQNIKVERVTLEQFQAQVKAIVISNSVLGLQAVTALEAIPLDVNTAQQFIAQCSLFLAAEQL